MRYTFLFFCFGFVQVQAQVLNLPQDTGRFMEEYTKQVTKAGAVPNPGFNGLYDGLDEGGKKAIISFVAFLSGKGLKPFDVVRVTGLLGSYQTSQEANSAKMQEFIEYLQKSFANYPGRTINDVVVQMDAFFSNKTLFNSAFSTVTASENVVGLKFFDKKQPYFSIAEKEAAPVEVADLGWGDIDFEDYDPWKEIKPGTSTSNLKIPDVQGLFVGLNDVNLVLKSPSDSIVLQGLTGAYNFVEGLFVGEGGRISWIAGGKPVEATLGKFSFKPSSGRLVAEHVFIKHEKVLKDSLEGVLELKLEKRPANIKSLYPRFISYHNNANYILPIDKYEISGGYTLVGDKVSTTSVLDKYTKLNVKDKFEVIGVSLTLGDSLITADKVRFAARFGTDSVTHEAVRMTFDMQKDQLQLHRLRKGGFRNSMFSDTFHQVDILCDAMSWNLNQGQMSFYIVAGKSEVPALFESFDHFSMPRLSSLSSAAGFNPLMAAANLVGRKKENKITVEELMIIVKRERYLVQNGLLIGNQMGFFDYHPFGNYYSISRKGMHYYLAATGKKDYDDLVFSSLDKKNTGKNATIDFNSKALEITGAQDFKLSDSLGIRLEPKDNNMEVIGNKVFSFSGKIIVKNYTFYGDFVLEYEKFLVNLKRIDSITFIPQDVYKVGGNVQLGANFQFGKTGKLYLNSPDNKSGRKKLLAYPKLEIDDGVTVHFNEKGRVQKFGDGVVFQAKKLSLDSLNAVDPVIPGQFTLAGIMKPLQDNLRMMPDSTMGMKHIVKAPYPLYGTQSTLTSNKEILLNKRGIFGGGKVAHLAAELNIETLKLYEDHAVGVGTSGKILEKSFGEVYFPNMTIDEFKMHWKPDADSLAIASEKGFKFYNESSILTGSVTVRTPGLFGTGSLQRADSHIESQNFKFNKTGFLAGHANLKVKAGNEERDAFSGKNLNLDFNVVSSLVNISPQTGSFTDNEVSQLEFPYSAYATTIDKALWKIKEKTITMEGDLETSVFKSTAKNQYGLKFHGRGAKYDIDAKKLSITGVEEIHTADAAVLPPGGNVFVQDDGKLAGFTQATIVADTLNRYHTLTNADVTVNSRLSYTAKADYRYVNVSLDTFNIKLGGFEFAEVSETGQILDSKASGKLSTIARAKVTEADQVFLAKKMLYKGELTMLAPFKNLFMKGQVLPDLKRYPMIGGSWIDYQGSKSENVSINIDETLKDGGKPLYVGLHMKYGANTDAIYPSFLSMKGSGDDSNIFLARGSFGRDEENQRFYVKPLGDVGNGAEFYEEKGILKLNGAFNLLGAPSKVFETVGTADIQLDSMKYRFNTMMLFDFPLPIPTVQKLGENVVKANLDAGNTEAGVDLSSDQLKYKLGQIIGSKDLEKYLNDSQKGHMPLFKQSSKFLKSLVLSDLDLVWHPTANAYINVGAIGVSNIGDVDINATVNGYVEIAHSHSTGSEIHIYFDLSPSKWYYFVYRNGMLGTVSSDEEVNKLLNTGSDKEKKSNFIDVAEAQRYKKRFLQNYLGITEQEQKKQATPSKKKKVEEEGEGF